MRQKSKRTHLIDALKEVFFPLLQEHGFTQEPRDVKGVRNSFPLGRFVRTRGGATEFVEIQFDKSLRPKFVINFWRDPARPLPGWKLRGGTPGFHFVESCRLYPGKSPLFWFSMSTFTWPRTDQYRAEKTVRSLVKIFPEVEEWFATDAIGKHVRMTGALTRSHPEGSSGGPPRGGAGL